MARLQTENVKAFDVAAQPWRPQGLPEGIGIRVLNEDDASGAVTAVLDIPAGWRWQGPGHCLADQAFFHFERSNSYRRAQAGKWWILLLSHWRRARRLGFE